MEKASYQQASECYTGRNPPADKNVCYIRNGSSMVKGEK